MERFDRARASDRPITSTARRVRVTTLVENLTDMLLTDDASRGIRRFGLIDHFRPPHGKVIYTENGIAYWIEVDAGEGTESQTVLFDTGLTGTPLLHNIAALGLDPEAIGLVVISHAHPDHYGGLARLLAARSQPTPVVVHPDAFLEKVLLDGRGEVVLRVNDGFERERLESSGACFIDGSEAVELAPGLLTTGAIPREAPFEPPVPSRSGKEGIFRVRDGALEGDEAPIDDQAVVIDLEGDGLVVLTACGHAGVVNTFRHAQRLTGVETVIALMGGFHTGFPGVPDSIVAPTVAAIEALQPRLVAPMHCSGFRLQTELAAALPKAYVQNVVGTSISFGS